MNLADIHRAQVAFLAQSSTCAWCFNPRNHPECQNGANHTSMEVYA